MKKIIYFIVSLIMSIAFLIGGSVFVYAENVQTGTSMATIEFDENTGPTKPVDPENPGTPDPEKPEVPGSLSIIYASDFSFEEGIVSPLTAYYDITTNQPNVQVVDLRGTNSGWDLNVSLSPFNDADEEISLKGARMHLYDARMNSVTSSIYKPTVIQNVILTSDSAEKNFIKAEPLTGQGLWVARLYPETGGEDALVQLEVPAGTATTGLHEATITWTLSNTP